MTSRLPDTDSLIGFLNVFQVATLGDGDAIAGVNMLASMAITLADLAAEDGSVSNRDGSPARLGTNLLIIGSASSGRAVDEIITEVGRRQTNLVAHLQYYLEATNELRRQQGATLPSTGRGSGAAEDVFSTTQSPLEPLFGIRQDYWCQALMDPPNETVTDLAACPKFLVSVARPKDLESQLNGLRRGRPLVHLGFSRPSDLPEFSELGAALVEGRYVAGNGCETVRANFLITDSMQVVREAANTPDERTGWLKHFLWLSDGDAGPEGPPGIEDTNLVNGDTITGRFRDALGRVMTSRLNLPEKRPVVLHLNTRKARVEWTAFLKEMESRLPGISGAARNLLTSLVFGFDQISRVGATRLEFSIEGVVAFARFLVLRMTNARTAILHASEIARRRLQIERVFGKLGNDRADARMIYKNLNIPAAESYECLRWLETAKLARCVGGVWEQVEGARLNFANSNAPLLEV
ncbi:MAG: hypothetical protein ABIS50_23750 [Luteolibacter sp.]|uniref:hypothetical protein n=1 Tax=Luteolibacter sp. TaxID=1962973 RepID=UPI00326685C1